MLGYDKLDIRLAAAGWAAQVNVKEQGRRTGGR
jgi:hypothetical protein